MNKQTQPNSYRFELRHKRKPTSANRHGADGDQNSYASNMSGQEKTSLASNVNSLEEKNRVLKRKVDLLQLELLNQADFKEKLVSLQESHASLRQEYQQEKGAQKKVVQQLQDQLDTASLAQRRTEEQLLLTGSISEAGLVQESKSLLDSIQAKYSEEVSNLTTENRVKDKTLQEMREKRITLVSWIKKNSCPHNNSRQLGREGWPYFRGSQAPIAFLGGGRFKYSNLNHAGEGIITSLVPRPSF